jgi:integrase
MDITLYKRKDSSFYWMKWVSGGKLCRESTKTTNVKKARKIKQKKESDLLKQRGIVGADEITLKDMIEEVLFDYKANGRKSTYVVNLRAKTLYDFFDNNTKVIDITEDRIHKYITYRLTECKSNKKESIKPGTVNRELMLLKRGFSLMVERHLIGDSPTIKMMKEDNVRRGFFEHWEYIKLMEKASEHIKQILTFIYHTGWRLNEALNVTWDMVDVDNGVITLPPGMTKNKKGRHYYMPDNISEMIRNLWSDHVARIRMDVPVPNFVFINKKGTDRIKDFRGAWKNSCERAALKGKLIHDFRRTAARNYVRAGVPQRVAQDLLGHQTPSIFSRYNIVSDTDLKTAAKKMTEYLNGQGENKPVEAHPHEFREWEPTVKEAMGRMEEMKKEGVKYYMDKYMTVIQMDEDGGVIETDEGGNQKVPTKEPKVKK